MKKGVHNTKITEHYLIPFVLFIANICLMHMLYAFEAGVQYNSWQKTLVCLALLLIATALVAKHRMLMIGAACFYVVILCWFVLQFTP